MGFIMFHLYWVYVLMVSQIECHFWQFEGSNIKCQIITCGRSFSNNLTILDGLGHNSYYNQFLNYF